MYKEQIKPKDISGKTCMKLQDLKDQIQKMKLIKQNNYLK